MRRSRAIPAASGPGRPRSANRAWTDIEHDLVDPAALVPVTNPISTFVVSKRAGNLQINPRFDGLLRQIWVKLAHRGTDASSCGPAR